MYLWFTIHEILKHFILILVLCTGFTFISWAQCPEITKTTINPSCTPSCTMCEGETFTVTLMGGDLPNNGKIEYYYSDNAGFNPYNGEGTKIGSANITTPGPPCRICPSLLGFMIDACGTEQDNEFIIMWTGSGFNTSNFNFNFDANNNIGAGNGNIGSGCSIVSGNAGLVGGCMATAVGSGYNLPANAIWIVFTSANASTNYDFSAVCGFDLKVFVSKSSCSRSIGGFSNSTSSGNRTQGFTITGCSCGETVTYSTDDPAMLGNGDSWAGGVSNNGCSAIANSPPGYTPAISTIDPFTYKIPPEWCDKTYEIVGIVNPKPNPACCDEIFTERFEVTVKCPKAFPSKLEACDLGNGNGIFTLSDAELEIIGIGSGTVEWFKDMAGTMKIFSPYTSNAGTIYARVIDGTCKSPLVPVKLIILPMPVAKATMSEVCDDGNGIGIFDLTALENNITGGNPTNKVKFWQDKNKTIPVISPYQTTTTTIYATTCNDKCESQPVDIKLIVLPILTAFTAKDSLCDDGTGKANFQLTNLINKITGNKPGLKVIFYDDSFLTNIINPPFLTGSITIYATTADTKCESNPVKVILKVIKLSSISFVSDKLCDDGFGNARFDLKNIQDLLTQNDTSIQISWYEDTLGMTKINPPIVINKLDTIYAFAQNGNCISPYITIVLEAVARPKAKSVTLTLCADSSGQAIFDLSTITNQVNEGSGLFVGFAEDSLLNKLIGRKVYTFGDTVYGFTLDGSCTSIAVPIILKTVQGPIINNPNDTTICGNYIVPKLRGINLTPNASYYTGPNRNGTQIFEGDTIKSSITLYPYDQNGQCIYLDSFDVIINLPVDAGQDHMLSICEGSIVDLKQLLIKAQNGGQFYEFKTSGTLNNSVFNSSGQNGKSFQFFYKLNGTGLCPSDSSEINISVVRTVSAGLDTLHTFCETSIIDLSNLLRNADIGGTFNDLKNTNSLNQNIWDSNISGPGRFDIKYEVGDGIICPKDSSLISIQILPSIDILMPSNIQSCDYLVLPVIQGKHTNGSCSYYTGPTGTGIQYHPGDTIRSSQNLFIYGSAMGLCDDETNISIKIDSSVNSTFIQKNLCSDEFYVINNVRYDINHPTGKEILQKQSIRQCDSIIDIHLDFLPENITQNTTQLCEREFIIINNVRYDIKKPQGQEVIINGSANGCDSIINIDLKFFNSSRSTYNTNLCEGTSIQIHGKTYNEKILTGIDTLTSADQNKCDSIVTIMITVNKPHTFQYRNIICEQDSININGNIFNKNNAQLQKTITNGASNGCDSLIDIQIQFYPTPISSYKQNLCDNQSININNTIYNKLNPKGTEILKNASVNGCDSLVDVDLIFKNAVTTSINQALCESDSILIHNQYYHKNKLTGIDTIKGGANGGCDSILNINLKLLKNGSSYIQERLCENDSKIINGVVYNIKNPKGVENIKNGSLTGCDSIINIDLDFFNPKLSYTTILSIIPGGQVLIDLKTNFIPFKIEWSPNNTLSCSNCLNPIASPTETTTYNIILTDTSGCSISATITIIVEIDDDVFIPNVFSPNGDQVNDILKIIAKNPNLEIQQFVIFDRWGATLYLEQNTTIENHHGWDGTFKGSQVNPGAYVYYISTKLPGTDQKIYTGDVMIIR